MDMKLQEIPWIEVKPLEQPEGYLETLLGEIYNTLEETKFKLNSHREKNAGKGYTASYGLVIRRPQKKGEELRVVKSIESIKNPHLGALLNELATVYGISYTTIQVNKNYITKPHIDIANHNDKPSYLMSLGDYKGGMLVIQTSPEELHRVNANGRMISFHGSKLLHWNEPHTDGNKYSLVFYDNKRIVSMMAQELKAI